MLLYVVCAAGEFIWNEGGVVLLPAPYITLCDFSSSSFYEYKCHIQIQIHVVILNLNNNKKYPLFWIPRVVGIKRNPRDTRTTPLYLVL